MSFAPPPRRTAASMTVSGNAVTFKPVRSTMSAGARFRRLVRIPGRRRWLLTRGTVTSTISGANFVSPSHHAAVKPLPVAAVRTPIPRPEFAQGR